MPISEELLGEVGQGHGQHGAQNPADQHQFSPDFGDRCFHVGNVRFGGQLALQSLGKGFPLRLGHRFSQLRRGASGFKPFGKFERVEGYCTHRPHRNPLDSLPATGDLSRAGLSHYARGEVNAGNTLVAVSTAQKRHKGRQLTIHKLYIEPLVPVCFTIPALPATMPARNEKKGKCGFTLSLRYLEREKSLELSTYTLARYRSTN
ncbi:hypothetical protein ACCAA_20073 [Candidatus Accumulibacter aalborgensis]|uniref:Uncharacterized protein n=1 Tax=Candidatus Accumulibacter aalborgensis TaxID=1860102 RepID=A0A1A8XM05_9PROT|nr:hypothetical protein ACCAA_20073 [Candidatus Accumulibacter aalborgensis]